MVVTGDRADGCSVWTSDLVTKKGKTDLAKQRKGNSWQMSIMNESFAQVLWFPVSSHRFHARIVSMHKRCDSMNLAEIDTHSHSLMLQFRAPGI